MTTIDVLGTCHHDCPDSCGWVATAVDGVLTSVKGNPNHPYSKGELCPKVNKFVGRVHHDDRLLHPLIRTGPKGSGEFRRASWEDALELVVSSFTQVRDAHGGQSILPWWSAGTQGLIQNSGTSNALFAMLGASRQIGSVCGMASGIGMAAVYGHGLGTDPLHAAHADQIILWGTNTRLTNRHLWPTIDAAQKRGARAIVVDPIRTITADKADQHIQPLPGTDVAMLLAMINVLIAEDRVDHEYVANHAVGYDELAAHVATHTPEWAAVECGVDPDVIRSLARSLSDTPASLLRALIGIEHHHSGPTMYRLLSIIPVLTGSHKVLGGGFARSVGSWAEVADVDTNVVGRLADGIAPGDRRALMQPQLGASLTTLDDPIRALFIWNGNPILTMPDSAAIRRGLEREDLFTVVSEQFMTDTARYADVIFPAAMETEQLDVMPAWGHLWLGWNEPATEPLGEAVSNTELFRRLATAFGFDQPALHLSDLDQISMAVGDHVDIDTLRSDGFVRVSSYPEDHLPYANGGFHTPSGKAELVAESLVPLGVPRLPEWQPIGEGPGSPAVDTYPLFLQTPKKATRFLNTSYSDLAAHADRETRPHIELDPSDAIDRGLADGDMARVFNDRGSLTLPVAISDRLRPQVVSVPWGYVVSAYDGVGSINDLTNASDTVFGSGSSYGDTLVQVEAAT